MDTLSHSRTIPFYKGGKLEYWICFVADKEGSLATKMKGASKYGKEGLYTEKSFKNFNMDSNMKRNSHISFKIYYCTLHMKLPTRIQCVSEMAKLQLVF